MKKILFFILPLVLLAVGCNKTATNLVDTQTSTIDLNSPDSIQAPQTMVLKQKVYTNTDAKFEINIPESWTSVVQNSGVTFTAFFYPNTYTKAIKSDKNASNPLLAIMNQKVPALELSRTANIGVTTENDISNFLTHSLSEPSGKEIAAKVQDFNLIDSSNNINKYLYVIQSDSYGPLSTGYAWASRGRIYRLEAMNASNEATVISQMDEIARTFKELK